MNQGKYEVTPKKGMVAKKYREDHKCDKCQKDVDYVFELLTGKKVCQECAARVTAASHEHDGEDLWDVMEPSTRTSWRKMMISFKNPMDLEYADSDFAINVKKHPILKKVKKMVDKHPEMRHVMSFADHKEIQPHHLRNAEWVLKNMDMFNDKNWFIETQKHLHLLAYTGSLYQGYYISLIKFIQRRRFLSEKQLASVAKNKDAFKGRMAKRLLRNNIQFSVRSDGFVSASMDWRKYK